MTVTAHVAALQTFHEELFSALQAAWKDEKKHRGRRGADLSFGAFLDDCSPDGVDLGRSMRRIKLVKADSEKRTINMDTMQTIDMHVFKDSNTGRSRIPLEQRERLWVQQEFFFSLRRAAQGRAKLIGEDIGHFEDLLRGTSFRELRADPRALLNWSSRIISEDIFSNRQTAAVRNGRSILRGLLARQREFKIKHRPGLRSVFALIGYEASCAAAEIADERNFEELSLILGEMGVDPDENSNNCVRGVQWILHDLRDRVFRGLGRFEEFSNPYMHYAAMMHGKPMDLFWFPDETRVAIHCYWVASLDAAADASANRVRLNRIRRTVHNLRYLPCGVGVEKCAELSGGAFSEEIMCSLAIYGAVCQLNLRNLSLAEHNLTIALRMLRKYRGRRYSAWSDFYTVLGRFMGASGHHAAQGECLLHVSRLQSAIGNSNAENTASNTRKALLGNLLSVSGSAMAVPPPVVSSDLVSFLLETPPPLVPNNHNAA